MTEEEKKERARARALVILQVQAGQKTATQAAQELGVSRQTYHQWEKRGMQGLLEAVEEQPPGRPAQEVNPRGAQLEKENLELKKKLAVTEEVADLRGALLRSLAQEPPLETSIKKKKS